VYNYIHDTFVVSVVSVQGLSQNMYVSNLHWTGRLSNTIVKS